MRMLFLRIFAGVLLAVLATQALGMVLLGARFRAERDDMTSRLHAANVDTLASQLQGRDPAERAAVLARFQERTGMEADIRPGVPPRGKHDGKGPPPRGKKGKGAKGHPPPMVTVPLGPGEHLVIRPPPPGPAPLSGILFAVQLGGVVVIVAGVCWMLAAPVVRDLQALESTVRRLGADDLDARAVIPQQGAVKPLAEGFNAMADRVHRLVIGQRQLFQAVSHELRTPNARIRFLLEALRDADDPTAREGLVRSAEEDLEEVDALLDELLTYLRFDVSGPLEAPTPFDLADTLDGAAERVRPLHPDITLTVAPTDAAIAVPHRWFARAIENLLTNAVRHATAQVRLSATRQGNRVVVDVEDDGPGVPEADRSRIFEPFASGDPSRDRKLGGVGLGLAIVARIAERHGATLTVDDSDLGGARFRTSWPAA